MHTRSATLLAVALSLFCSTAPASAQGARAALVKQSDIIFIGTVTQVGAVAVPEVPASDRTIVVRVDQVLERPPAIALGTGDSVTVQTARPGSLKAGIQATFYTTGWIFGRGVAVREVGHEPGRAPVGAAGPTAAIARAPVRGEHPGAEAAHPKGGLGLAGRARAGGARPGFGDTPQ